MKSHERWVETGTKSWVTNKPFINCQKSSVCSKKGCTYIGDKISIKNAKIFLDLHFPGIRSVTEWSETMGYSRTQFWKKIDHHFKTSPQEIYLQKKKQILITTLRENIHSTSRQTAIVIHLPDGDALYQFVKRHFKCSVGELKERIENGDLSE
jgi:hypothetical protein